MKFQIGKSGVTEGVIVSLRNAFKTHKIVRVSVLKGAAPSKDKMNEMAEKIEEELGNVNFRIIGFTIVLKRFGASLKENKAVK